MTAMQIAERAILAGGGSKPALSDAEAIAAADAACISGDVNLTDNRVRGGVYLMLGDTTRDQVARGGGGTLSKVGKIRGWEGVSPIPGDVRTTAEALRIAGLDWRVIQQEVGVNAAMRRDAVDKRGGALKRSGDDSWRGAERFVANVREDTGDLLGIVGKDWRGPQNADAFGLMDAIVDDGSAKWLGAGERDGGRRVFGLVQWNREIIPGGDVDEKCTPLGFICNGWDGTLSLTITSAPFRLACLNGQMIPLPGYSRTYKVRHTSGVEGKIEEARRVLGITFQGFDLFERAANEMIVTRIGESEFDRMVRTLVPDAPEGAPERTKATVEEKRAGIFAQWGADDLANVKNTAWGAYQAVTAFADWGTSKRTKDAAVEGQRRLFAAFGHESQAANADLKMAAYRILVGR